MSIVALPYEYEQEAGTCKTVCIMDMSVMEPVGMMRAASDLPVDLEQLSQNFASMLNGRAPLHVMKTDYQMFYEPHSEGLTLRFRHGVLGGVSKVGALFTLTPGVEMEISE